MLDLKRKPDCIMVYMLFFSLFEPSFLPNIIHQGIKLFSVLSIILYIFANDKKQKIMNIAVLFGGCISLSSFFAYQNHYISLITVFHSIYYAICLYCIYIVMEYFAKRERGLDCLQYFLDIVFVYCVLTLITVVFPVTVDSTGLIVYAFGNKFSSSYLFLLLLGLFYTMHYSAIKTKLEWRVLYFVLIFVVIAFGYIVECSTAMVSGMFFLIIYLFSERIRIILMNCKVVFVALILSGVFPVLMDTIVQNRFVQYIIVDVLGESLTLSYRNIIYRSYLFQLVEKSPIWGFGYSNTAIATMSGYAFGNAQNALFDTIIDYGYVGAIALIITILYCYKHASKGKNVEGISLYIYSLIIAGILEVTYSRFLFVAIFLLRWLHYAPQQEEKIVKERKRVRFLW